MNFFFFKQFNLFNNADFKNLKKYLTNLLFLFYFLF